MLSTQCLNVTVKSDLVNLAEKIKIFIKKMLDQYVVFAKNKFKLIHTYDAFSLSFIRANVIFIIIFKDGIVI